MRATWASSYRWLLAGLLVLCGLNFARPAPTADVKVALVIGNTHYTGTIQALENASTDAKTVADALIKDGFSVTLKYDLNKADFGAALDDFAHSSQDADISLFYFAGHGVQYRGQNYLLPTDNIPRDNQDIRFKSVPMKDVVDAAIDARKAKIIILDACRNGKPDPAKAGSRAVTGLGDASGLAAFGGSDGLVVFYSAQPNKQALDKGPFASSLANHIAEPGRDIQDVFKEVTRDVLVQTKTAQEPEQVTASLTVPVILNPDETPEAAWHKLLKSEKADEPEALKDFIKRFPDSDLADSAQTKLDNIDLKRRDQEKKAEDAKRAAAQDEANKEREKQEAARQEAERQRKANEEAEKVARDKQLADQQAADAVIAAQLKKAEEERQRIAKEVDAERTKRQQAEAEAKQKAEEAAKAQAEAAAAKELAQQQNNAKASEAARRDAEEKAREAKAAEDVARQAKLDEKAERDRIAKITADTCARDMVQLDKYKQGRQRDLIQSLRGQSICPTIPAAADQALADVTAALAKTCDAERKFLSTIDARNETALKDALGRFSCETVRNAADGLLAGLEEDKQRMVVTCADERAAMNAIDPATRAAKPDLLALRAKAVCPDTPKAIEAIVSAIDERVTSAQGDLIRLACLDKSSGAFDEATENALTKYLHARNAPAETPRITQGLVDELSDQDWKVCAPPQVASTGTEATKPTTGAATPAEPKTKENPTAPVVRTPRVLASPPKPKPKHAVASNQGDSAPIANRSAAAAAPAQHSPPIEKTYIPGI